MSFMRRRTVCKEKGEINTGIRFHTCEKPEGLQQSHFKA